MMAFERGETSDLAYSTKIWLTSVIISPIILYLFEFIKYRSAPADILYLIFIFILVGAFFSLPAYFSLLLANSIFFKLKKHVYIRILNQIISIIFCYLTFWLALPLNSLFFDKNILEFSLPYIFSLSFGVWFYHLK